MVYTISTNKNPGQQFTPDASNTTIVPEPAPAPNSLADIESKIASIRASAASLADQQNQPVLAQQIRNPNTITPPSANNTGTIIDFSGVGKPPLASAAIAKISAGSNNLPPVPTNEQDYTSILSDLKNQLTAAENPTFSEEAKMQQEYTDMGVFQNIDLIKSITSQSLSIKSEMDKLDQAEADAISSSYNNPGMTLEIANNGRLGIQRDFEAKKAPLAASLASLQTQSALASNNLSLAKSYADTLIAAATYDAEAKATAIAKVGDLYADVLASMSKDDQNAYAAAQKQADATLAQQTAERKTIISWATTAATAPALVGVDLSTISFDDAADKVRNYVATKVPTTSTNPDNSRVNTISSFITSKQGVDKKIAWETYAQAAQKWIALGGTTSDFKVAFPPEVYMDAGNLATLPSSLKPAGASGSSGTSANDFYNNL